MCTRRLVANHTTPTRRYRPLNLGVPSRGATSHRERTRSATPCFGTLGRTWRLNCYTCSTSLMPPIPYQQHGKSIHRPYPQGRGRNTVPPISLLSCLGKAMERVSYARLKWTLGPSILTSLLSAVQRHSRQRVHPPAEDYWEQNCGHFLGPRKSLCP